MIGLVIVAHKPVASGFYAAAHHVLGVEPARLKWLDVESNEDTEALLERARILIAEVNEGDGVLVCSDICGATPCNTATRLAEPGKVNVISGLNLPMLLRAINYRYLPLEELTEKAFAGGMGGVMRMERNDAEKPD
ncbi:MAG: PTS fructose transporter subunit IIA [Burkholderiales bacterium]